MRLTATKTFLQNLGEHTLFVNEKYLSLISISFFIYFISISHTRSLFLFGRINLPVKTSLLLLLNHYLLFPYLVFRKNLPC